MRKVNTVYVLALIGSIPFGVFLLFLLNLLKVDGGVIFISSIVLFFWYIFQFIFLTEVIWQKSIKKLSNTFNEHSFSPTSTFESNSAILYLDVENGKIGTITKYNPLKLQIIDAKEVEKVHTDKGSGIFGGTRLVRFCFTYKGKKWGLATFTSTQQTYSFKSEEVLTALSKADLYVEIINEAKKRSAEKIDMQKRA